MALTAVVELKVEAHRRAMPVVRRDGLENEGGGGFVVRHVVHDGQKNKSLRNLSNCARFRAPEALFILS